jgi:predicted unusual protein kinase regulating ubiquinone biosynthesis (AarF/ABC1/UbiB family)
MSEGPRIGRVSRTAPLVGLAGRTAGEAVVSSLRRRIKGGDSTEFHVRNAERYAERLGRSKGVLMKAGQLLSLPSLGVMIDDEYQPIYQQALSRLQDDAPPMEPEVAAAVVEAELGRPPGEVFAEFATEPLAAASIGQVHAARLADGRRVAVKVQYPGVDKAIRADLANAELLATFFQLMRSVVPGAFNVDTRAMAREVSDRIGEEIDYRIEAANQQIFADTYRGHPFIRIPEVAPELSTQRVLTMDLVEGMRFGEALKADQALRDKWGEAIMRFSLGTMRRSGLFNADPHPGNYLFHEDGTVTFLDFGCVKRFSPEQVGAIQNMVRSAALRDKDALVQAMAAMVRGQADLDPDELLSWYTAMLWPIMAPQPFTYTPEWAASVVRSDYSPTGPHGDLLRKMSPDSQFIFLTRIDFGMSAILGALHATGPWRSISAEWDWGEPPLTEYGRLEAAYLAKRRAEHATP